LTTLEFEKNVSDTGVVSETNKEKRVEIDFSLAVSLMPNDTVTNHQFFFLYV